MALAASTLHLGRPQYAFRGVIGLRHSWLSREILTFGIFAGSATLYATVAWLAPEIDWLRHTAAWTTVITGVCGILCSTMIYVFTRREFWNFAQTVTRFLLTAVVLGCAATWLSLLLPGVIVDQQSAQRIVIEVGPTLIQTLLVADAVKLAFEAALFRHLASRRNTPLKRSAALLIGRLSNATLARFATGLLGGVVVPMFLLDPLTGNADPETVVNTATVVMVAMIFAACLIGEILERFQFFAAVSAARMPGNIRR